MSLKAKFVCEAWIDDNAVPTGETFEFDISNIVRAMDDESRRQLRDEVAKIGGQDLDYIAERAGVVSRHDGPFTVKVDEDELEAFVAAGMPGPRYLVCESSWGHIFDEAVGEIPTRWVFDLQANRLVAAEIATSRAMTDMGWTPATRAQLRDLEDSIVNANSEALEKPYVWDLEYAEQMPEFAVDIATSARKRKIALVAVAFDDDEDNLETTSDMATFVEAALGHSVKGVNAIVYANADALRVDIEEGYDPFAEEVEAGAVELASENAAPVPAAKV